MTSVIAYFAYEALFETRHRRRSTTCSPRRQGHHHRALHPHQPREAGGRVAAAQDRLGLGFYAVYALGVADALYHHEDQVVTTTIEEPPAPPASAASAGSRTSARACASSPPPAAPAPASPSPSRREDPHGQPHRPHPRRQGPHGHPGQAHHQHRARAGQRRAARGPARVPESALHILFDGNRYQVGSLGRHVPGQRQEARRARARRAAT